VKHPGELRAARRLARAIQGKGAFRRFRDELHDKYPDLLPAWHAFRDVRARRRAVRWPTGNSLIDDDAASASWPATQIPICPDPLIPGCTPFAPAE